MGIKYKDPTTGQFKDISVKVADSLPIGTEVDYDGETVPTGWEEVDDPNVYSIDEVRIGTWIDGKPLYRKVITGTLNTISTAGTNITTDLSINVANRENTFIGNVWAYAGTRYWNLPFIEGSNGYVTIVFPTYTNEAIRIRSNDTTFSQASVIVEVLYTKTTDTASSSTRSISSEEEENNSEEETK